MSLEKYASPEQCYPEAKMEACGQSGPSNKFYAMPRWPHGKFQAVLGKSMRGDSPLSFLKSGKQVKESLSQLLLSCAQTHEESLTNLDVFCRTYGFDREKVLAWETDVAPAIFEVNTDEEYTALPESVREQRAMRMESLRILCDLIRHTRFRIRRFKRIINHIDESAVFKLDEGDLEEFGFN